MSTLLPLLGFLVALHVVPWSLDHLLSAGLLAQIAIGVIWGPLAELIGIDIQQAIRQLGYVGLILLVYEGRFDMRTELC